MTFRDAFRSRAHLTHKKRPKRSQHTVYDQAGSMPIIHVSTVTVRACVTGWVIRTCQTIRHVTQWPLAGLLSLLICQVIVTYANDRYPRIAFSDELYKYWPVWWSLQWLQRRDLLCFVQKSVRCTQYPIPMFMLVWLAGQKPLVNLFY